VISPEQADKLKRLARGTGRSQTGVLRWLLDHAKDMPEVSLDALAVPCVEREVVGRDA